MAKNQSAAVSSKAMRDKAAKSANRKRLIRKLKGFFSKGKEVVKKAAPKAGAVARRSAPIAAATAAYSFGKHAGKHNKELAEKQAEVNKARTTVAKGEKYSPSKPKGKTESKPQAKPDKKQKPVKKAKNSEYKVYKKSSDEAKSFREAFAAARKGGQSVFTWQGRKYNTKVK